MFLNLCPQPAENSLTMRLLGCFVPRVTVPVVLSVCTIWHSRLGLETGEDEMTKQKYLSNQRQRCKGPCNPFSGSRTLQGASLIFADKPRCLCAAAATKRWTEKLQTLEKNCAKNTQLSHRGCLTSEGTGA